MNPVFFSTGLRSIRRARKLFSVLAKHGLGELLSISPIARAYAFVKAKLGKERLARLGMGARLRLALEELGPTYIKFGQALANRPDLLPDEIVEELSKLHDEVPPFPFAEVKSIIEQDLGDFEQRFKEFEEQPVAAASIAQVHRAVTSAGHEVAVKVKRPGIEQIVEADLFLLHAVASRLEENSQDLARYQPVAFVEEFAEVLRDEMNFLLEVRNMERFAKNFAGEEQLKIPKVFHDLSSSRIITMEFLHGWKVTDIENWKQVGISPEKIAELGTSVFLKSIFEHRFFHADPHPGNFVVMPQGSIGLLDFGMMGRISKERLEDLVGFMMALLTGDSQLMVNLFVERDLVSEGTNIAVLRRDIDTLVDKFASLSLEEIDVRQLMSAIIKVARRHKATFPADMLLVSRALSTMEGIALQICPDYRPLHAVRPYLTALFLGRSLDPTNYSRHLVENIENWAVLLETAPKNLSSILRQIRKGNLKIGIQEIQTLKQVREENRKVNRLALSLLSAATGVGSSLLITSSSASSFLNYLGYAGLTLSSFLLLWVLWAVLRSGGA